MGSEKLLIDLAAECEASGTDFGKGRAFGILETLRELSDKDAEIERLKAQLAASEARVTILCVNDTNKPVALSYAAQAWGNHQIPAGKALAIVEVKP